MICVLADGRTHTACVFQFSTAFGQQKTSECNKSPMLIKIQPDATVSKYLFTAKLLYMFRVSQHPSSGVLKTVTAASGTGHTTDTATSLQRGLIGTGLCKSSVNKNPSTCNSMQIFIYCKATLHVSGVTAPILRSTKNQARSGHVGGK